MTDNELKELEELRAYKAQMEAKPVEPEIPPLDQRIMADYNKGIAIVEIARRHSVSVEKILVLTGNSDLLEVSVIGDQVDPSEIGNQGTYNPGQTYQVRYTTN
jgi:beta-phosphoglucomutase-like phosphatase (HAD superfamily)